MALTRSERLLILLSAGTAPRRRSTRTQAQTLAASVDWQRLAANLQRRRLLGTLGPRIIELAPGMLPESFEETVQETLSAQRRAGASQQLICLGIVAGLARAGIGSSPLKGALLGEAIYGDPGRRSSSDIDLLVSAEDLARAAEVVRAFGYLPPRDHLDRDGVPQLHVELQHAREELPTVELHWRVHWYERRFAAERLLPPAGSELGAWHPRPVDELAALLLFYARDGFQDLRLACDIAAFWDRFAAALPAGALGELTACYPALGRALRVSASVAERVVGLPASALLDKPPGLTRRERLAIRLARPDPGKSEPQLYADTAIVDALLMPAGQLRAFLRRQLLPARTVLEERARRSGARHAPRTSIGHGVRVLPRYAITLAHLTRAPQSGVGAPGRHGDGADASRAA